MSADLQEDRYAIEAKQEAKLQEKYGNMMRAGNEPKKSAFLMKRIQKNQKYFDSGDYNVAKHTAKATHLPVPKQDELASDATGHEIPKPQQIPHPRKLSVSKLDVQRTRLSTSELSPDMAEARKDLAMPTEHNTAATTHPTS